MLVAVISDLHLGSGGQSDSFGHDDGDFLRFLRFLEHEFEQIVLLGDIWETLSGAGCGDPAVELGRARRAHPAIAARFARPVYRYVHGNHDLVTARTEGVPGHYLLNADGMRLLFTHGHQYDWRVQRARSLVELAVRCGGWLRHHGLASLYRWAERVESAWAAGDSAEPESRFQQRAVASARQQGADVIVTGHTHVLTRGDHGDRVFLNSGSCKDGHHGFLAIDTRGGRLGVHNAW